MKKELPIAACLLAIGISLCWNIGNPSRGQASAGNSALPTVDAPVSETLAEPAAVFLNIAKAAGSKQDLWCKSALVSAGQSLNRLPSIAARTQIQCRMHGLNLLASGKYFQTEAGKKSRLELLFDHSQSPLSVLQICDGQFSYTLRSSAKQQRLEFIDLNRLENKDAGLSTLNLPAGWVMGGGLGSTLIHYAEAFHFQAIETRDPERLHVRGIWDARLLARLIHSDLDTQQRPSEVHWESLPEQLPHAIELTFSKFGGEILQPETISLFRFTQGKGGAVANPMMTISFEKLESANTLPPALFAIESSGFEATEVTDVYNKKIRELTAGLPKVATVPGEIIQYAR